MSAAKEPDYKAGAALLAEMEKEYGTREYIVFSDLNSQYNLYCKEIYEQHGGFTVLRDDAAHGLMGSKEEREQEAYSMSKVLAQYHDLEAAAKEAEAVFRQIEASK